MAVSYTHLDVYKRQAENTADSTAETSETSVEVGDESFLFQLAVDGKDTVNVNPGDVITVAFTLKRTDADEAYTCLLYTSRCV